MVKSFGEIEMNFERSLEILQPTYSPRKRILYAHVSFSKTLLVRFARNDDRIFRLVVEKIIARRGEVVEHRYAPI